MHQSSLIYYEGHHVLMGQYFSPTNTLQNRPGIIVFPAFEGISEFSVNYGHWLAEQGYNVLIADIYGEGKNSSTIEGCFNLITPFLNDRDLVRRRALAAFDILKSQPGTSTDLIGAIGFCFGGMCALELARSGANLKALVSAHGVLAKSELPTHPIQSHLLMLHGFEDPQVPASALFDFAKEMNEAGVKDWEFHFFGQAQHSFTDPKTGLFDPEKEKSMGRAYNLIAAERTKKYASSFFNEMLKNI